MRRALLLFALCACSNDEPKVQPSSVPEEPTGPLKWSMTTANPSASAAPSKRRPLGQIAGSAKSIYVTVMPSLDKPEDIKTADITEADQVKAVLDALGPDKAAADTAPRCMTPVQIELRGARGNKLALVGICQLTGVDPESHGLGRLTDPPSDAGGWKVADLAALKKALKTAGVEIP